jgi:hypothetical protein
MSFFSTNVVLRLQVTRNGLAAARAKIGEKFAISPNQTKPFPITNLIKKVIGNGFVV